MRIRTGPVALSLALAVGTLSCAPAEDAEMVSTDADVAALEAVVVAWDAAWNAGDVDAILALYGDAPVYALPPNAPAAVGHEAIRSLIEGMMAQGDVEVSNEVSMIWVFGDQAVSQGTYTLTVTPEGGEPATDRGKWVAFSYRAEDGSWKARLNMWNSDLPLPNAG